MKKCLLISVMMISANIIFAQSLTNTKWEGLLNVPNPLVCQFEFKSDSCILTFEGQVFEVMTYQLKGDTLSLVKLSGNSPCTTEKGEYAIKINNDKLIFTPLNDPCYARETAFYPEGYEKVKN